MPNAAIDGVRSLSNAGELQALGHPTRVAILEALGQPAAAATVARALGQSRQLVNYHLKALERAGLVERVGERPKGNFVEALYRAVARSFVVSPQLAHSERGRVEALQRQHHLSTLLDLGDRIQHDAAQLLDQAAFDGEDVPSATVSAETRFATPEDRATFMDAYLASLRDLLERHGSSEGEPFRVVMAVYPDGSR